LRPLVKQLSSRNQSQALRYQAWQAEGLRLNTNLRPCVARFTLVWLWADYGDWSQLSRVRRQVAGPIADRPVPRLSNKTQNSPSARSFPMTPFGSRSDVGARAVSRSFSKEPLDYRQEFIGDDRLLQKGGIGGGGTAMEKVVGWVGRDVQYRKLRPAFV
jgi:hypothetical protein